VIQAIASIRELLETQRKEMQFNCIDSKSRAGHNKPHPPPWYLTVRARLQLLTALVSIALLALDAVLSASGHSHAHPAVGSPISEGCHAATPCGHHHGCCSHDADDSSRPPSDSHDKDDCSLCRHFNQPVVVVSLVLELPGSELVVPLVLPTIVASRTVWRPVYPARGPPSASI
jgi:hypothetical protein